MAIDNLDVALLRAAADPGARPAFYELLMRSEIFALVAPSTEAAQPSFVSKTHEDGTQTISIFTSQDALVRAIGASHPPASMLSAVKMHARELMEITQGAHLQLNPQSTYGCSFTPKDIASLLKDGTIHNGMRVPQALGSGIDIPLVKLNVWIPAVVLGLRTVFSNSLEVTLAYLVETVRPGEAEMMRRLMMVALAPPSTQLTRGVSTLFSEVYNGSLPVDLCFDRGDKGLVKNLQRIGAIPFYDKGRITDSTTRTQH